MTVVSSNGSNGVAHIPAPHTLMRTLVVGAGVAGRALARDLAATPEFGLSPVGFLDDEPDLSEPLLLPVLGTLNDLTQVARTTRIDVVVLAIPRLDPTRFRDLVSRATAAGASVRYLPSFVAALERTVAGSDVRWLDVSGLLGRDEVHVVSPEAGAEITDRVVMVTGAGGSIGSELCRQVFGFGPRRLVMLDHDESNLHRLQLELFGNGLLDTDDCVVADIRDVARIDTLFAQIQPDIVFHAAAHKHLPLLEQHPCEAVKSNVRGTENVLWAAIKHEAEKFILVSTDKAADPSSVLGATKRLAEMLVQQERGGITRLAAVRFGNVLGSRGSLLSVLAQQLQNGLPMTVTHPEMTRFFMTIEEAAGLVIEASRLANDGEIFVLDMGEPVRILDVVESFAKLMNRPDIQIRFTGMREGEKLTERLFSEHEESALTAHPRIYRTVGEHHVGGFHRKLRSLYDASALNDAEAVRVYLRGLLPDYHPHVHEVPVQAAAPYADDY